MKPAIKEPKKVRCNNDISSGRNISSSIEKYKKNIDRDFLNNNNESHNSRRTNNRQSSNNVLNQKASKTIERSSSIKPPKKTILKNKSPPKVTPTLPRNSSRITSGFDATACNSILTNNPSNVSKNTQDSMQNGCSDSQKINGIT